MAFNMRIQSTARCVVLRLAFRRGSLARIAVELGVALGLGGEASASFVLSALL